MKKQRKVKSIGAIFSNCPYSENWVCVESFGHAIDCNEFAFCPQTEHECALAFDFTGAAPREAIICFFCNSPCAILASYTTGELQC